MTDRGRGLNIVRVMTMIRPTPSAGGHAEGRAVKVLLAAKDMSQRALADRVGIDKATLSLLLNGHLPHRTDLWRQVWIAVTTSEEPK